MNSLPRNRFYQTAFTLIELLTVITIIAILMGLLFPAIAIVKEQARKAQAKVDVAGIATAVKQYYTEYGKYPIGSQPSGQDLLFGDSKTSNKELFDILRNIYSGTGPNYNPRGIVFFEGRIASSSDAPRAGFVPTGAKTGTPGAFVDPWGQEYQVAIDGDYDNQITNLPYTDFKTTAAPRTGVAVFSLGKDTKLGDNGEGSYRTSGKASDDIITWQ